jgi:hypothetical protein
MTRTLAVTAVAVAVAGGALLATEIVPMDFREAVADASLIVRGHVTDVRGIAEPTGVSTVVTVAVDLVLKGQAEDFISVRVPGGTIGRYRYVFVGAPTFSVNEQAVFLLKRGPDNALRPVGLSQGIYEVRAASGGGPPVIAPPLVAPHTASTGQVVRGDSRRKLMSVGEFESLVRLVMAGQGLAQDGRR